MGRNADLEYVILVGGEGELSLGVGETLTFVERMSPSVGDLKSAEIARETVFRTYMDTGRSSDRLGEFVFACEDDITMNLLFQTLLLVRWDVKAQCM